MTFKTIKELEAEEQGFPSIETNAKKEVLKEVLKLIDKMFPICTCIDGRNGMEPNKSCKNELMDGAWTNGINKELKARITGK